MAFFLLRNSETTNPGNGTMIKRQIFTAALLGVCDAERRALVSALTTLSASQLLSVQIEWAPPAEADILIVDVDQPDAIRQAAGLDHLWPRARIRYGQRGTAADISRPLRAHALASAVEAAVVQLAEPANHELGAPLNAEAERLDAPAAPEAPRAAPTRVYRGQAY
jgi:hypothetical protein